MPMNPKRRIVILGATGSIGTNALRVIRAHRDRLELVGIAGRSRVENLAAIAHEFKVRDIAVFDPGTETPVSLASRFPAGSRIHTEMDGMIELATLSNADMVLIAVVGTTALMPCIHAIRCGKSIALASKEILVMAGEFILPLIREHENLLLPTDSEHNAIFQCIRSEPVRNVQKILLTASGGPYLHTPLESLASITPEEAIRHPKWKMGPKISLDSATMANKGLEVIEARWLFDLRPDQIEVVIHPQSIVHSMVQWVDGSILAQMSPPNMSFAIQNCLLYPDRVTGTDRPLDFSAGINLEFSPPDPHRFPCLNLAIEALKAGGTAPAVYNAANEVAVSAFFDYKIAFDRIPAVIAHTLASADRVAPQSIEDIIQSDTAARRISQQFIHT